MTPSCPSDLALEAHLLEPAASALGTHLSSCADCAARLAAMERQGEDFRRFVYPATVARIEEAARHRGWRLWVLAPVPVFAAAALAGDFARQAVVGQLGEDGFLVDEAALGLNRLHQILHAGAGWDAVGA